MTLRAVFRSPAVPAVTAGAGALALIGLWLARRSRKATEQAMMTGGAVPVRLTTYYPYQPGLTAAQRKMEGGTDAAAAWRGRKVVDPATGKRAVVYTLEEHLAGRAPYTTVSGDPNVWPFGQRLLFQEFPAAIFRVTDTGGHFTGAGKVFRVVGHEPLDIAVNDDGSRARLKIPRTTVAYVVPGDNWEGGKPIAAGKLPSPTVVGEAAHTPANLEALARMIESCCRSLSDEEARAAAWSVRNRATLLGVPVHDLLAPNDEYGADVGGYASTRREASPRALRVALEVLSAAPAADSTGGASGFWIPRQQDGLKALGDAYRAAEAAGDETRMERYARYAGFDAGADEVRRQLQDAGVQAMKSVGAVELLR